MTTKEIATWIREWFREHPNCNKLDLIYEDFIENIPTYEYVGKLTELIWKIEPLKYLSYIPEGMFCDCKSITNMVIPNHITSIGTGAFIGCSTLTSIIIPESVTTIGDYAFSGCYRLTNVTMTNSITNMCSAAFADCGDIQITYSGTIQEWKNLIMGKTIFPGTTYVCRCSDGVIYQ